MLEDEIDISRGDMLVHPHNLPHVERQVEAMLVWMSEEPAGPGTPYLVKHTTRTVPAVLDRAALPVDVNTLHRQPAEGSGAERDRARRRSSCAGRSLCDPYRENRATGAVILIDRLTNARWRRG